MCNFAKITSLSLSMCMKRRAISHHSLMAQPERAPMYGSKSSEKKGSCILGKGQDKPSGEKGQDASTGQYDQQARISH